MTNAPSMINACIGDLNVALMVLTVAIAVVLFVLLAGIAACMWQIALTDHDIRKKVAQDDLGKRVQGRRVTMSDHDIRKKVAQEELMRRVKAWRPTTGMRDESRPAPPPNPHRETV